MRIGGSGEFYTRPSAVRSGFSWAKPTSPRFGGGDRVEHDRIPVVRLVLDGAPKPDQGTALLQDALRQWPGDQKSRFLLTPGGFLEADWPEYWQGKTGWKSRPEDFEPLTVAAQAAVDRLLTPALKQSLKAHTDYLTLGVDVVGPTGLKGPHAELVAVYDTQAGRVIRWTGKSYPTASQNTRLVQARDLDSHFITLPDGERVMILGCNDLNMFSPRVKANQTPGSPRAEMCEDMQARTRAFNPTTVLQHPHATDTPNIWRMAWLALERGFEDVATWASAIRFFNPRGEVRKPLDKVLDQTRSGAKEVRDIVIDTSPYVSRPSRYFKALQQF